MIDMLIIIDYPIELYIYIYKIEKQYLSGADAALQTIFYIVCIIFALVKLHALFGVLFIYIYIYNINIYI